MSLFLQITFIMRESLPNNMIVIVLIKSTRGMARESHNKAYGWTLRVWILENTMLFLLNTIHVMYSFNRYLANDVILVWRLLLHPVYTGVAIGF